MHELYLLYHHKIGVNLLESLTSLKSILSSSLKYMYKKYQDILTNVIQKGEIESDIA